MKVIESGIDELFQSPDMNAFREWNRKHKSKALLDKLMTEHEAISRFVCNGAYIGMELYGTVRAPMSLLRELIRQGHTDLGVVGPGVLNWDFLLTAGQVRTMDITYNGLEVYGTSQVLRREIEAGRVKTMEWSNGAFSWRLKATAMGVPFIPVRAMLGTDTFKHSTAKVVKCPFTEQKIALLPALILDIGLIHVHRADRYGNAQVDGISGFAAELARASKRLIISAEEIVPSEEIRRHPDRTIIPYYLVDAVVHAPFGSHPGEMVYYYERDEGRIKEWVEASKTEVGAQAYLDKYVYSIKNHEEYLALHDKARLDALVAQAKVFR